jgi:hypothetical protein
VAQTVGQHGVAAFTSPVNGDPLNATVVVANDNATRGAYVDHDSDPDIHVQSSLLASRPAAGTVGRKWMTTDSGAVKLWFDTGSAWSEIAYLPSAGGTVAGNVSITGTLGVTGVLTATGGVVGAVTGNASTATALQTPRAINGVNFDGTAAITVPAAAGTLTGATLASNVLASSLTSVGTLAGLTVTAPITGSVTGSSGSTTGNAATATALQTVRTINGTSFDGTANVTVTAAAGTLTGTTLASGVTASSLTSVGTLANLTVTNPITGSVTGSSGSSTGNAATATALQTSRNINGTAFNGTADITVTAAAGTLTGATLSSGVTASSLTSVGTLTSLAVSGAATVGTTLGVTGAVTLSSTLAVNAPAATDGQTILNADAAALVNVRFRAAGVDKWLLQRDASNNFLVVNSALGTNAITVSPTSSVSLSGNLAVDTNTLFVDATNNRVGVGTVTPLQTLHVSGGKILLDNNQGLSSLDTSGTSRDILRLNASNQLEIAGAGAIIDAVLVKTLGVQRMFLDSSGNLGLGVTPSAWAANRLCVQIGGSTSGHVAYNAATGNLTANAFFDTTDARYEYIGTGFATRYEQTAGTHAWHTAASGTAGNAITFTQAMTLQANGDLGLGTTSVGRVGSDITFQVQGTSAASVNLTCGGAYSGAGITVDGSAALQLRTVGAERWRISSTGHFLAATDATYDIGASGATRPRDYYGSGNSILGGFVRVSAASAGVASTTTIGSTTATTVGATGAASALPALPLGYIIAHVGTTQVKIPYYTA